MLFFPSVCDIGITMENQLKKETISETFNEISKTYDLTNRVLSFGIDTYWRKKLKKEFPQKKAMNLLDLATGTADQLISLVKNNPQIETAIGLDLAEGMLQIGSKKLKKHSLDSIASLQVGNAEQLDFADDSIDCITMSFGIRNLKTPLNCMKESYRCLRDGGRLLILEFSIPKNPIVKTLHLTYLRHILPTVGGLISKKKEAYKYLNETIEDFPYGTEFCNLLKEAGFKKAIAKPLTFGIASLYIAEK